MRASQEMTKKKFVDKQLKFVNVFLETDASDRLFSMKDVKSGDLNLKVGTCIDKTIVGSQSFLLIQNRPMVRVSI
jgi:hypothetical protein